MNFVTLKTLLDLELVSQILQCVSKMQSAVGVVLTLKVMHALHASEVLDFKDYLTNSHE